MEWMFSAVSEMMKNEYPIGLLWWKTSILLDYMMKNEDPIRLLLSASRVFSSGINTPMSDVQTIYTSEVLEATEALMSELRVKRSW